VKHPQSPGLDLSLRNPSQTFRLSVLCTCELAPTDEYFRDWTEIEDELKTWRAGLLGEMTSPLGQGTLPQWALKVHEVQDAQTNCGGRWGVVIPGESASIDLSVLVLANRNGGVNEKNGGVGRFQR
jgi:hypothetical protein